MGGDCGVWLGVQSICRQHKGHSNQHKFHLADQEKIQPSDETHPNTETIEQMIATDSQNQYPENHDLKS